MGDRVAGETVDRVATPLPAILLCGGCGTRLAGEPESGPTDATSESADVPSNVPTDATAEKPLVRVGDEPMVDRVIRALRRSDAVGTIHAVASPHTPETIDHLRSVADRLADGKESTMTVREGSGEG
jgi:adenosylcobinamide-phosphate guanylyltransferase